MTRIDEVIAHVSKRIAEGNQPPGDGFLMLIDRSGGRALGISLFDSLAALEAAEPEFERMGEEIPEELRGRTVDGPRLRLASLREAQVDLRRRRIRPA